MEEGTENKNFYFMPLSQAQLNQIKERGYSWSMTVDGIRKITSKDVVRAEKHGDTFKIINKDN